MSYDDKWPLRVKTSEQKASWNRQFCLQFLLRNVEDQTTQASLQKLIALYLQANNNNYQTNSQGYIYKKNNGLQTHPSRNPIRLLVIYKLQKPHQYNAQIPRKNHIYEHNSIYSSQNKPSTYQSEMLLVKSLCKPQSWPETLTNMIVSPWLLSHDKPIRAVSTVCMFCVSWPYSKLLWRKP